MDMTFDSDETQYPDDILHPNFDPAWQTTPELAPECNSYKWKIKVIDGSGEILDQTMTTKDVWKLQNRKVIVHFDEETGQPDVGSAGLFGSWLGQLSTDVGLLPIDYTDWRVYPNHRKEAAWNLIKKKISFDDPEKRRKYAISVLDSRCKDLKVRIWKTCKRSSRNETLANRPSTIPHDQWQNFVNDRYGEKWKKLQEQNIKNQKKNVLPHSCGRKSFARKQKDIFKETGKKFSRAEFFIQSCKKQDGTFVNEEAKERDEQLTELISQNPTSRSANIAATLDDDIATVFGPERSGRIRCLGRGPTASQLQKHSPSQFQIQEQDNAVVDQLRSQVTGLTSQVQILTGIVQQFLGGTTVQPNALINNLGALGTIFPTTLPSLGAPAATLSTLPNFTAMLSTLPNLGAFSAYDQALQDSQNGAHHEGSPHS